MTEEEDAGEMAAEELVAPIRGVPVSANTSALAFAAPQQPAQVDTQVRSLKCFGDLSLYLWLECVCVSMVCICLVRACVRAVCECVYVCLSCTYAPPFSSLASSGSNAR